MLRWPGYGRKGDTPANPSFTATVTALASGVSPTALISGTYPNLTLALGIPAGAAGTSPANPSFTATANTLSAGSSATAAVSGTYPNLTITLGVPQGSNATATPLATTTPADLGTATVGTSSSAARADHVHNKPTGTLTQVYTGTIGETLIIGLSLGVRRYTVSVSGITTGDRLILALAGAPSNGTIQDAYVTGAGSVSVGLLVPALAIGAVIAVPIILYKVA